ncbi:MAG: tetratricopeptide repeat protein [bacterium]|nr:tetratricopeptide repeat protein [bacterium]
MSMVTNQDLSRAYDLIEQERLEEARSLLKPLLEANPNNPDVWWLYTHAVEDAQEAQGALENVLRLDPQYPGASALQQQLEATRAPVTTGGISALGSGTRPPITLDDDFSDFDLDDLDAPPARARVDEEDLDLEGIFDDEAGTSAPVGQSSPKTQTNRRQLLAALGAAAFVILAIVVVLLIVNPFDGDDQPVEPTNVAQGGGAEITSEPIGGGITIPTFTPEATDDNVVIVPTLEITPTETLLETEARATELDTDPTNIVEPATETPLAVTDTPIATATTIPEDIGIVEPSTPASGADFGALYAALAGLDVVEDSAEITETALGRTLLVSVCSQPGAQLRQDLDSAMVNLASQAVAFTDTADAIGTRLLNCTDNSPLNVIAVNVASAVDFVNGAITREEFRGQWRPVR